MHLNHFGVLVRVHFATLGVTFEAFWGHFCTLEVILGALWVYFLCPKTDWGAKGAPSGASPKIPSPFGVLFLYYFSIIFVFGGSIQRASEETSKNYLFEPSHTSKTKPPPRREHDLQVLTKFSKNWIIGCFWDPCLSYCCIFRSKK